MTAVEKLAVIGMLTIAGVLFVAAAYKYKRNRKAYEETKELARRAGVIDRYREGGVR